MAHRVAHQRCFALVPMRHFILLTMYDDMQDIKDISIDGQLIDHVMKRSPLP